MREAAVGHVEGRADDGGQVEEREEGAGEYIDAVRFPVPPGCDTQRHL